MLEFDLIQKYFSRPTKNNPQSIKLNIGDDCAVLDLQQFKNGENLAISVDTFSENTHFLSTDNAFDIAWKALAVNLSDLAACAAEPCWFSLAIALPENLAKNSQWLQNFSDGLFACADKFNIVLIGGDTTKSEKLSITINVLGKTKNDYFLTRKAAQIKDDIWISGQVGLANLGLKLKLKNNDANNIETLLSPLWQKLCLKKLHQPTPRLDLAKLLAEQKIATSCIDISDGLWSDLSHIAEQSKVLAELNLHLLPIQPLPLVVEKNILKALDKNQQNLLRRSMLQSLLGGGDDYELCFTAKADEITRLKIAEIAAKLDLPLHRIGEIKALPEDTNANNAKFVRLVDAENNEIDAKKELDLQFFTHF